MALVPLNYYDLLETLPRKGCAICNLVERDVFRFLDSHLYEYVNTPDTHAAFRAGRGLCAVHTAQLADFGGSVLGITILSAGAVDELLALMGEQQGARTRFFGGAGPTLADRLEPVGTCMACSALERAEKMHLRTLVDYVTDPRMAQVFETGDGLCLPHFRDALRAAPGATQREALTAVQVRVWRQLKTELEKLADQYDVNRAEPTVGPEGDSWRRAGEALAGRVNLFGLRARKAE